MVFSSFLCHLFIILFFQYALSFKIDVYCPSFSRFQASCNSFFNPTNLNLTNTLINLISDESNIQSKVVVDLHGSLNSDHTKGFFVFKPVFTYDYICDNMMYYSSSIKKSIINRIYIYYLYI